MLSSTLQIPSLAPFYSFYLSFCFPHLYIALFLTLYRVLYSLLWHSRLFCSPSFPSLATGFPQNTHPSFRSGVTVICGRWVRFPSIGVWTAWTRQGCWPRLNSARETRVTWEPWAPSARSVVPRGLCLSAVSPYTSVPPLLCSIRSCRREEIPSVAFLRPELTIRSPSGKVWTVRKPQSPN